MMMMMIDRLRRHWLVVNLFAAIKFPPLIERAWLATAGLGFLLDVLVYHTFSLCLRSLLKFLAIVSMGTNKSTLAGGMARGLDTAGCALSGIYNY
jgi:hypothetical protein